MNPLRSALTMLCACAAASFIWTALCGRSLFCPAPCYWDGGKSFVLGKTPRSKYKPPHNLIVIPIYAVTSRCIPHPLPVNPKCHLKEYLCHVERWGKVLKQISPRKRCVFKGLCGAATRSRTRDLMITNQLLYQLSYSGLWCRAK